MRAKVTFRAFITVKVDDVWEDSCGLDQVRKQATRSAQKRLDDLRGPCESEGLVIHKPELESIVLLPDE